MREIIDVMVQGRGDGCDVGLRSACERARLEFLNMMMKFRNAVRFISNNITFSKSLFSINFGYLMIASGMSARFFVED